MTSRTTPTPSTALPRALRHAARGDTATVLTALDRNPALLNAASPGHNRTLLWEAASRGHADLVCVLISRGADPNTPGRYRHETFVLIKPHVAAVRKSYCAIADHILSSGATSDIFTDAFLADAQSLAARLADAPSLANARQSEDTVWHVTPLHHAVAGGRLAAAQMLIDAGAEVAAHTTLLYDIACRRGDWPLIRLLAASGASPAGADAFSILYTDDPDIAGFFFTRGASVNTSTFTPAWPPIVYVSRGDKGQHPERVRILIHHGAAVNARGPHGLTALHVAARAGFTDVIRLLIDTGADPTLQDARGHTARDVAVRHRRPDAIAALN